MISQIRRKAAVHSSSRQTFSASLLNSWVFIHLAVQPALPINRSGPFVALRVEKCLTNYLKSSVRDKLCAIFRTSFILLHKIIKHWNVSFQQMALENVKRQPTHPPTHPHTHIHTIREREAAFEVDMANVISHVCVGHGFQEWSVQSLFNWCVAFSELISTCKCIRVLHSQSSPCSFIPSWEEKKSGRRLTLAERRWAVQLSLLMAPLMAGEEAWSTARNIHLWREK